MNADELRRLLHYDPDSGVFTWKLTRGRANAGDKAGYLRAIGYVVIRFGGRHEYAHRLAWVWMTGEQPPKEIDHINGNRGDNRWTNLRASSPSHNMQNVRKAWSHNKSTGLLGAYRNGRRFRAVIRANGRNLFIGAFDTADEAHAAYLKAKRELHEGCTI